MQIASESRSQSLVGKLPRIDTLGLRASNFLFDARLQALLRHAPEPLQTLRQPETPTNGVYKLRIECEEGVLEWAVSAEGNPSLSMAAATDLNARLRLLAAQAVLAPVVDQLQSWGFSVVQAHPIEVMQDADLPSLPIWCALKNRSGAVANFAPLQWPEAVDARLRHLLRTQSKPHRTNNLRALSGTVVLGTRAVGLNLLRSLNKGDVLLTAWSAHESECLSARVYWGAQCGRRLSIACRVSGAYLKTEGETRMKDDSQAGQSDLADDNLDALGDMDIPVRFEVETVSVPLSDLEAIQPGYVIELTAPLEGASIRLVAFGQTIGHAELVAVGDKLGARIIKMVARDESN
jgi:type III secretion protein Q